MRFDSPEHGAGVPLDWWGPVWSPRSDVSLADLVNSQLLPLALAGLLWALIDRNASVVVAAGPSGAGKSTLLTALLEFLPESKARVYARGMYESFDFADRLNPAATAILVNEISAHLPVYLWGPPVRRLFALGRAGFQFFATCHAESVEDLVYGFSAYPIRATPRDLNAIDVLIFLRAWREGGVVRREIERVVSLRDEGAPGLEAIMLWNGGEARIDGVARAFSLDLDATDRFEREVEGRIAELWDRHRR
jgi:type IV secretory pathway ATPase VirB11/archaellum biosynthesis ATPase